MSSKENDDLNFIVHTISLVRNDFRNFYLKYLIDTYWYILEKSKNISADIYINSYDKNNSLILSDLIDLSRPFYTVIDKLVDVNTSIVSHLFTHNINIRPNVESISKLKHSHHKKFTISTFNKVHQNNPIYKRTSDYDRELMLNIYAKSILTDYYPVLEKSYGKLLVECLKEYRKKEIVFNLMDTDGINYDFSILGKKQSIIYLNEKYIQRYDSLFKYYKDFFSSIYPFVTYALLKSD